MTPIDYEIMVNNTPPDIAIGSGYTVEVIDNDDKLVYQSLRCVIKMTEYTPISGGSKSELDKNLIYFFI